jgi:protein phosphatase 1 regulatory subunit 7
MSANTGENIQDSNVDAEIEAKKNELEKQIIYYPHAEQIDLNTFSEDVEQIDLSMSRIDKIEDFSRFTNLNSLCFRSNLLKSLASDNLKSSKGFAQIKELDFYDNQIEKIENLDELVTLETLDLSFNRLSKIEKLDSLTNLKKLYFVHNKIAKIENLEKLTQLEMLELGDNQLRQVENLDKLTNLKQL